MKPVIHEAASLKQSFRRMALYKSTVRVSPSNRHRFKAHSFATAKSKVNPRTTSAAPKIKTCS